MSEDNRCERCRGEIKALVYQLRLVMEDEPEPVLSLTICDYCRKSFDGWVSRRKRTGKGQSTSSSDKPDSSSRRSSSSRSGSSKRSSSSSQSTTSDSILESAKSSFSSMIEAARAGMIEHAHEEMSQVLEQPDKKKKKRKREEEDEDEDLSHEDLKSMGLDSPTNYMITIVVVLSVFVAIGLVLSYLTS